MMNYFTRAAITLFSFLCIWHTAYALDDYVTIQPIDTPLSLDLLSLKPSEHTGFRQDGWADSSARFASLLLESLPEAPTLPILQQLQKNLLISGLYAPSDNKEINIFFKLRLKALARMGDTAAISRLLEHIPASISKEDFEPSRLASLIISDKIDQACPLVRKRISRSAFWQESVLFCDMHSGESKGLELDIAIMQEENMQIPTAIEEVIVHYKTQEDVKKYVKESWKLYLKESFFTSTTEQKTIYQPVYVRRSPLSAFYTYTWWNAVDKLPLQDKLTELSMFYTLLEYRNVNVQEEEWRSLAEAALINRLPIPEDALKRLLALAASHQRQVEGVALILYALKDINTHPISADMWEQIMATLHTLGFPKTARKLFGEGIFSDARVRSNYGKE